MTGAEIWRDDTAGMTVHVNGGHVEIGVAYEMTRLEPAEALAAAAALTAAVTEAAALAARWDGVARRYSEVSR